MRDNSLSVFANQFSSVIYPITLTAEDRAFFAAGDISKSHAAELYNDMPLQVRAYVDWCEPKFDALMLRAHKSPRSKAAELTKALLTQRQHYRNNFSKNYLFEKLDYNHAASLDLSVVNAAYIRTTEVFDQKYRVILYRTKYGRYELQEFFTHVALSIALICHYETKLQSVFDGLEDYESRQMFAKIDKASELFKQFLYLTEEA